MKQIVFQPKEEIDLNDRLVNLYGSKLVGLYTDLEPLFEREGNIKPSLPLLLWLLDDEAYKKADVKVMIFGRETNNWNDARRSNLPNGTYNFGLETSDDILGEIMGKHDSEDEIYGICDTYESYCAATAAGVTDAEVKPTQFTRRFNQLVEKLKQSMPGKKVEVVWNNIHKIGKGCAGSGNCCGEPTAEIREIVRRGFNVVPDEVEILRPDIVIFLTGSQADNAIMQTFDVDKDAFEAVRPDMFIHRVNLPGVKYAARTIHPSRKGDKEIEEYFDTLIADIKKHM